ncbi:hypothetical protein ALC57_15092 [Trachymyrmex cornetzi]|uniref:THAP domain-containing protein 9 n=1 Tax=Trachymyrmex cornetzi TaxID=471704 RepID=A0A151IXE9_9HYME|nr:hypothetical protein ALC57_15092 [Trachymyrmex cornetzi]
MFCLSVYRRSRCCYKFISEFLLCPSFTTLNTQLNRIPIIPGCNNIILQYLTLNANKMDVKDLNIILAWDEMAIKPALTYDVKNDKIIGFEDWGMTRTRRYADHAIVFYIRCLSSEDTFYVGGEYIVPLYDYVHLQKGVRNNLLNKDLFLNKDARLSERESQCASWDHIITAYEVDRKCFQDRRRMRKLTDSHIFPPLILKMKVKFAVQVLSHTVADFIDMILSLDTDGIVQTSNASMALSKNSAATKEALYFFDDLFDSFNGNSKQGLSSIITQNSGHLKFWQEALHKLNKMEFVEKKSYKSLKRNKPKCLINWRRTIKGVMCLWKMLQTCGFTSLDLKYCNQDHVENFFSGIRRHGHQNNNPTPYLFNTAFKALLTCNITSKHSLSANCKEDEESFLPLLSIMRTEEIECAEENETVVECETTAISDISDVANSLYIDTNKIVNNVKKKMKNLINCAQCNAILEDEETIQILECVIEFAEEHSYFFHETNVKQKFIKTISQETLFTVNFHCTDVQNIVLDTLAHYFILEWCNIINKILNTQANKS